MTIQECIDASLQLLNQYTIMGNQIPDTYNDQEDDKLRMVNLINDAVMEIATVARPLEAKVEFVVPEPDRHHRQPLRDIEFTMPAGFDRPLSVLFTPAHGYNQTMREANDYKWVDDETLLVPNKYPGTYTVVYMRFPAHYTLETPPDTVIDNTPDTHAAIPYYVAAMVANYDDQKAYYNLFNQWEIRLSRLGYKPPHATYEPVQDVYRFF